MYKNKKYHDVQRIARRVRRAVNRYKFDRERYITDKYKNGPYHNGSELWDDLPREDIESGTITY